LIIFCKTHQEFLDYLRKLKSEQVMPMPTWRYKES
jgi:hypothetical protein